MPSTRCGPQRSQPKQARSRDSVDRVLIVAGELFVERGYPNVTTNHIAELAGISVGSLYRFFADKRQILAALQDKWTTRVAAELDKDLNSAPETSVCAVIDQVLEVHAILNREQPGLLGFLLTFGAAGRGGVGEVFRSQLAYMIKAHAPQLSQRQLNTIVAMSLHITNGLYSTSLTAGAGDPAVRDEVRAALLGYLGPIVRYDVARTRTRRS